MHFSLKYLVLSISPLDNDSLVILREVLQSTDRTLVVMVQLKYYLVLAYRQNPLRLPHLRKYLHLGVIFHLDHFLMIYSCFCRSEEHTSELQSRENLVCRLLLEKKKKKYI